MGWENLSHIFDEKTSCSHIDCSAKLYICPWKPSRNKSETQNVNESSGILIYLSRQIWTYQRAWRKLAIQGSRNFKFLGAPEFHVKQMSMGIKQKKACQKREIIIRVPRLAKAEPKGMALLWERKQLARPVSILGLKTLYLPWCPRKCTVWRRLWTIKVLHRFNVMLIGDLLETEL